VLPAVGRVAHVGERLLGASAEAIAFKSRLIR